MDDNNKSKANGPYNEHLKKNSLKSKIFINSSLPHSSFIQQNVILNSSGDSLSSSQISSHYFNNISDSSNCSSYSNDDSPSMINGSISKNIDLVVSNTTTETFAHVLDICSTSDYCDKHYAQKNDILYSKNYQSLPHYLNESNSILATNNINNIPNQKNNGYKSTNYTGSHWFNHSLKSRYSPIMEDSKTSMFSKLANKPSIVTSSVNSKLNISTYLQNSSSIIVSTMIITCASNTPSSTHIPLLYSCPDFAKISSKYCTLSPAICSQPKDYSLSKNHIISSLIPSPQHKPLKNENINSSHSCIVMIDDEECASNLDDTKSLVNKDIYSSLNADKEPIKFRRYGDTRIIDDGSHLHQGENDSSCHRSLSNTGKDDLASTTPPSAIPSLECGGGIGQQEPAYNYPSSYRQVDEPVYFSFHANGIATKQQKLTTSNQKYNPLVNRQESLEGDRVNDIEMNLLAPYTDYNHTHASSNCDRDVSCYQMEDNEAKIIDTKKKTKNRKKKCSTNHNDINVICQEETRNGLSVQTYDGPSPNVFTQASYKTRKGATLQSKLHHAQNKNVKKEYIACCDQGKKDINDLVVFIEGGVKQCHNSNNASRHVKNNPNKTNLIRNQSLHHHNGKLIDHNDYNLKSDSANDIASPHGRTSSLDGNCGTSQGGNDGTSGISEIDKNKTTNVKKHHSSEDLNCSHMKEIVFDLPIENYEANKIDEGSLKSDEDYTTPPQEFQDKFKVVTKKQHRNKFSSTSNTSSSVTNISSQAKNGLKQAAPNTEDHHTSKEIGEVVSASNNSNTAKNTNKVSDNLTDQNPKLSDVTNSNAQSHSNVPDNFIISNKQQQPSEDSQNVAKPYKFYSNPYNKTNRNDPKNNYYTDYLANKNPDPQSNSYIKIAKNLQGYPVPFLKKSRNMSPSYNSIKAPANNLKPPLKSSFVYHNSNYGANTKVCKSLNQNVCPNNNPTSAILPMIDSEREFPLLKANNADTSPDSSISESKNIEKKDFIPNSDLLCLDTYNDETNEVNYPPQTTAILSTNIHTNSSNIGKHSYATVAKSQTTTHSLPSLSQQQHPVALQNTTSAINVMHINSIEITSKIPLLINHDQSNINDNVVIFINPTSHHLINNKLEQHAIKPSNDFVFGFDLDSDKLRDFKDDGERGSNLFDNVNFYIRNEQTHIGGFDEMTNGGIFLNKSFNGRYKKANIDIFIGGGKKINQKERDLKHYDAISSPNNDDLLYLANYFETVWKNIEKRIVVPLPD